MGYQDQLHIPHILDPFPVCFYMPSEQRPWFWHRSSCMRQTRCWQRRFSIIFAPTSIGPGPSTMYNSPVKIVAFHSHLGTTPLAHFGHHPFCAPSALCHQRILFIQGYFFLVASPQWGHIEINNQVREVSWDFSGGSKTQLRGFGVPAG